MTILTAINIGSVHIKSNLLNVTMEEVSISKENPMLDICLAGNILLMHTILNRAMSFSNSFTLFDLKMLK